MVKYKHIIQAIETTVKTEPINKTHDGTSMGKLNDVLKQFIKDYAKEDSPIVKIVNQEGKEILTGSPVQSRKKVVEDTTYDELSADNHLMKTVGIFEDPYGTGNHNSETHGYFAGKPGEYDEETFTPFNSTDLKEFNYKNKDGEYCFRSITIVSNNGTTMTLIRNNDFSKNDEKEYKKACTLLEKDIPSTVYDVDESTTLYDELKNNEDKYKEAFHNCNVRYVLKHNEI